MNELSNVVSLAGGVALTVLLSTFALVFIRSGIQLLKEDRVIDDLVNYIKRGYHSLADKKQ